MAYPSRSPPTLLRNHEVLSRSQLRAQVLDTSQDPRVIPLRIPPCPDWPLLDSSLFLNTRYESTLIKEINKYERQKGKSTTLQFHKARKGPIETYWCSRGLFLWLNDSGSSLSGLIAHFTFNSIVTDSNWKTTHLPFLCQNQHVYGDNFGG